MSYSTELKRRLAEKGIKKSCCRRSLLYGLLSLRGEPGEGDTVSLSVDAGAVAPLAETELRRFCGAARVEASCGARSARTTFTFTSEVLSAHLREGSLSYPEKDPPCPQCLSHFLRGIFLASGRMSDFTKQYRLEFSANRQADELSALLAETVAEPKLTTRRGETVLYYKTNSEICDLLAVIGAEADAFALINETIEAGYRNAANRRANCEARNIERSVEASMRFVQLYRRLQAADKLKNLPEELRETARLRAENPTVSLATLGGRCTPPVSKSGMNHRLEKIERLASELLSDIGEEV